MKQNTVYKLISLINIITLSFLPLTSVVLAQEQPHLVIDYSDRGLEVVEVRLTDEIVNSDGSVTANISLISNTSISYGMRFSRESGRISGSTAFLFGIEDLIPLTGKVTQSLGSITFSPEAHLRIQMNKLGFRVIDAAALLILDCFTAIMLFNGIGYLPERPTELLLGIGENLATLLDKIGLVTTGVLTLQLQREDFIGAFRTLMELIETAPKAFADFLRQTYPGINISAAKLGNLVRRFLFVLGIIQAFPVIRDLTRRPREVQVDIYVVTPVTNFLDIVFAIDTTASMRDDIEAAKEDAINIINQVASSGMDWRIGIVTYRDHPVSPYGESTDYVSRIELSFSSNRDEIISAIRAISVDGGGDGPEAVYSALMAAFEFPWRDGAKKAIILMGDAPPHDPEPFTNLTLGDVLQAAFDIDPANIYPILIADNPQTSHMFQQLADGSSGRLFKAATADDVIETVFATIDSIAYEPELSRLLTIGGLARVNTTGGDRLNLRDGAGTTFPVIAQIPFGTTVTVLGGPKLNVPYLWWNIRIPDGQEGWAVEAADGLVTLIPVQEDEVTLSITAFPPSNRQEAIRIYSSLWQSTDWGEFQDIKMPSTVEYQAVIDPTRAYRLAFTWCADTAALLKEILNPLTVEFLIDDIFLTDTHILQTNLDGVCEIWETILTGWAPGKKVLVELHYNLKAPIHDGSITYEAGDYYHRIEVIPR